MSLCIKLPYTSLVDVPTKYVCVHLFVCKDMFYTYVQCLSEESSSESTNGLLLFVNVRI